VHIIAADLNVSTEEIAYVGDTNTDMETAVSAGCYAIGVSWGFRSIEELKRSGAAVIVDHPSQIVGLLS
jgi:phosphoglycolate phosphatase